MNRFFLVLAAFLLAVGTVSADGGPVPFSPANGPNNIVPGSRDVCWSEPVSLNDAKISSEIIGAFGLESELANDFIAPWAVTKTISYGGYYNWAPGDPAITAINWKFYDDGGCVPNTLLDTFVGFSSETFLGYDMYGWPTYKYEFAVYFDVVGDDLYWLGVQAADHPFPPQWGRQGTGGVVTNCDTVFKSAYFGYPNWTPAGDLVGAPFDAAQELECQGIIPVRQTSWGAVKGLFR